MKSIASISVSAMALLLAAGSTPAQAEGFSGFYAGVQLGVTDGDASSSQNLDTGGAFDISQADYKLSALSGGGHVGYTHQFDKFVVGAAFSIDLTDMGASDNQTSTDKFGFVYVDSDPGPGVTLVPTTRLDQNGDRNSLIFDSIYSLDAKGGWLALPGTLLYATGGWAWASADAAVDNTIVDTTTGPGLGSSGQTQGPVSTSEGRSVTFSGFTYGLGAEFQMTDSTTVGFQWRHYNLDSNEATFVQTANGYQVSFDPDLDTFQIKASYFFLPQIN